MEEDKMEIKKQKRKKKIGSKLGDEDFDEEKTVVKKKRKTENVVENENKGETEGGKRTKSKSKLKKPDSPKKVLGEKKAETELAGGEILSKTEKKSKLSTSTTPEKNGEQKSKSKEGKTMDYKKFHLKKMKEKWRQAKTKRQREKKGAKVQQKKTAKAESKSKKSLGQKSTEVFGPCDFSELTRYWNEFAASTLTAIEREELSLQAKNFVGNTKNSSPSKFFAKRLPDWTEWLKKDIPNGSPFVIVVSLSALRAAELNRDLEPFKGENCRTAKLFRKEQAKKQAIALTSKKVHLVVGTPHRIGLLLSEDNLKLEQCRGLFLDWSFEDEKKRRLITMPESRLDVLQLFRKYFISLLNKRDDVSLFLF